MKAIFCLLIGLWALPSALAQHSQYKGFVSINKELSTRLAPPGQSIDLWEFVPAAGLESLLGTWYNYGSEHVFKNGSPNPVNMLIWYTTLSEFSAQMGASCVRPQMNFGSHFVTVLNQLCNWPQETAKAEAVLLDFWFAVMGYNAPESEYVEWRDFFLRSYASKSAKETVSAMSLAITMNPFFLLGR